MRTKSLILGICATTVAATGAIAAFASNSFQTYYVRVGANLRPITISASFSGCSGTLNNCRVKLINPDGTTITASTTVYTDQTGTIAKAADALSGTVTIP